MTRLLAVLLDASDVFLMTFMILQDSYMEPTRVDSDMEPTRVGSDNIRYMSPYMAQNVDTVRSILCGAVLW